MQGKYITFFIALFFEIQIGKIANNKKTENELPRSKLRGIYTIL